MASPSPEWQSRIVGSGTERPDQLLANPKNWRVHPKTQQDAMTAVLDKVGWVQQVIVNRRTGNLVDGHMRVALADRKGEAEIPVVYVDLEPAEEDLILATLDPLGDLAATDRVQLAELLGEIDQHGIDESLAALLVELEPAASGVGKPLVDFEVGGATAQLQQVVYYLNPEEAAVLERALAQVGQADRHPLAVIAEAYLGEG